MSRITIFAAAILVSLPAVTVAQRVAPISVTAPIDRAVVSYADLDLGSVAGKRILGRRIAGAIEQVCGSFNNVSEWSEEDRIIHCRADARQSADRQLAELPSDQRLALNAKR